MNAHYYQTHFAANLIYAGRIDGEEQWLGSKEQFEQAEEAENCEHICSGNCRRKGCNCICGEWHNRREENE